MGIYDSGSNVSLINSKLLRIVDRRTNEASDTGLKTINGVKKVNGLTTIRAKIFNIEKDIDVFVIDQRNFDYDFLIGLDCIRKFNLVQNEKLEISQNTQSMSHTRENLEIQKQYEEIDKIKFDIRNISKEIENIKSDFESNRYCNKVTKKLQIDVSSESGTINFNEHVKPEEFNISINHLNDEEKALINELVENNKSVFAKDKYDVGSVKDYEAHIDLITDKYCSKRPYRCSIEDKKEIERQVSKLLERKLIEESYSPFAAPVTLAYKRDENTKSRLCVDFRDLNKLVVPQSQPFPLIEDLMIKTRSCKFFSTLDVNSAFWSIPLRISDRPKTAFVTQEGHFQWTCLPFGLKTAPAIFQRILSSIIRKYNLTGFAVNYIDDILVFSKSFAEHIEHLASLFKAIMEEGFKLKFSKCTFASDSVKYLGHIIQNNTIKPMKDNLISIKNFPVPKSQKNVRQFLGKINFYHKYIPNSAVTLDPLHNLLRKDHKFVWTKECEDAFDKMKKLLCSQPVLAIFDPNLPIYIYTDASLLGIGAVLKQPQGNKEEKPVAFFSKKLNEIQKRKKAIYLECLAIKECVKYWQYWLIGRHFTVFSDHKPLKDLNIKSRTDEELGDLTYYLSQYDFHVEYNPGKYHLEADCLSRNPVLEAHENGDEQLKIVNLVTLKDILNDQKSNELVRNKASKLIFKDNIYYKNVKKKDKILLSEDFSIKLAKQIHENFCHIGVKQLQKKISPFYTAKNLTQNIKKICKECTICITNKTRGQPKFGLMSHLGPAKEPFEIVSIDTIGGFGGSRSTKKYLHLLVDHFTRYAYILTSKTQNAKDFMKLIEKVMETEKIGTILSDQYPAINSGDFKKYLEEKRVPIIFTAVNSPFSNGLNERLNQTLINKIRCKINEQKKKIAWTTIAHECVQKYNETEHTVTGFAPSYLLNGKDVSILPDELRKEEKDTEEKWIQDRKTALKNTRKSHEYNKKIYDKNRINFKFNVGDSVFVENGNKLNRKKLDEVRIGPFRIIEKLSDSIYKVNTGRKKEESNLFHFSKLIPAPTVE